MREVSKHHDPPVTFFEAVTALGYTAFVEHKIDIGVVEVGIGGEFDATNVFDSNSLLTAILTPVGLEHTQMLGDTADLIATTKSKIAKPGRPLLLARQADYPEAEQAAIAVANEVGAHVEYA